MIKPYLENFYGNQVVIRPPENKFFEKLFSKNVIFWKLNYLLIFYNIIENEFDNNFQCLTMLWK